MQRGFLFHFFFYSFLLRSLVLMAGLVFGEIFITVGLDHGWPTVFVLIKGGRGVGTWIVLCVSFVLFCLLIRFDCFG